jgi:hypothetical protein
MTKQELITALEGYRVIITDPDEYTVEELEHLLTRVKKRFTEEGS